MTACLWLATQPIPTIPINVTNNTRWWVLVLPALAVVAGPTIVAVLAFRGIARSNATAVENSRKEREDARRRDYLESRRKELSRLGGEVVDAAVEALDGYRKLPTTLTPSITRASLGPIVDPACRRIAASALTLRVNSAPLTSERCNHLRDSIQGDALLNAAKAYQAALRVDWDAGLSPDEPSDETTAAKTDFDGQLDQISNYLRYDVGGALESALRQLDPPASGN